MACRAAKCGACPKALLVLRRDLIRELVNSEAGVLITTYEHLRRQHADLLDVRSVLHLVYKLLIGFALTSTL